MGGECEAKLAWHAPGFSMSIIPPNDGPAKSVPPRNLPDAQHRRSIFVEQLIGTAELHAELGPACLGSFSTHLAEIDDWLMSAPVRQRCTRVGPGALRLAGRRDSNSELGARIMRYELADHEWTAIKPMLPNKPRGVPRVNGRRVLNGIFWVLRSGAP